GDSTRQRSREPDECLFSVRDPNEKVLYPFADVADRASQGRKREGGAGKGSIITEQANNVRKQNAEFLRGSADGRQNFIGLLQDGDRVSREGVGNLWDFGLEVIDPFLNRRQLFCHTVPGHEFGEKIRGELHAKKLGVYSQEGELLAEVAHALHAAFEAWSKLLSEAVDVFAHLSCTRPQLRVVHDLFHRRPESLGNDVE